jgi:hypothetical protein
MFLKRIINKPLIYILLLALVWIISTIIFYGSDYIGLFGNLSIFSQNTIEKCNADLQSPDFYFLKTKLNIGYDAGQLFHMSENFLVHHAILENANRLSNSSAIYYMFDRGSSFRILFYLFSLNFFFCFLTILDNFHAKLNPFTRFIVLLSTITTRSVPTQTVFFSNGRISSFDNVPENQGILVPVPSGSGGTQNMCVRYKSTIGGKVVDVSRMIFLLFLFLVLS